MFIVLIGEKNLVTTLYGMVIATLTTEAINTYVQKVIHKELCIVTYELILFCDNIYYPLFLLI